MDEYSDYDSIQYPQAGVMHSPTPNFQNKKNTGKGKDGKATEKTFWTSTFQSKGGGGDFAAL